MMFSLQNPVNKAGKIMSFQSEILPPTHFYSFTKQARMF
jgi:hypothetical protein